MRRARRSQRARPTTDAGVVRVVLPRLLHAPWEIVIAAGLVFAGVLALSRVSPQGSGPSSSLIAGSAAVFGLSTAIVGFLWLRLTRLRRQAGLTIDRAAAGEPVADEDLCVAAAILGGANRFSLRRLRRQHLDAVEAATGRVLPRVWLMDQTAAAALASAPTIADEPRGWFKANTSPAPGVSHLVEIAFVLGAVAGSVLVQFLIAWGWLSPQSFVVNGMLGVFFGFLIAGPVRALYASSGWWLVTTLDSARLILLDRRGRPRRRPVRIDPVDTFVLIRRRGEQSGVEGKVHWRLLPPAPRPPIDAPDLQDGPTPWTVVAADIASGQHPAL